MIERLGPANIPQIQRLFERCSDFFELVEWIAAQSGTTLWIAVQTQNEAGERFWRRMGFEERRRQPYASPRTGLQSAVIVMSIRTTPSSPSR